MQIGHNPIWAGASKASSSRILRGYNIYPQMIPNRLFGGLHAS